MRGRVGERELAVAAEVIKVADKIGRTPAQVALAWVRQGQAVVIPFVGAMTREQLEDNLGCLEFELDPADKTALDEASPIELGFPYDFLGQFKTDKVINHRDSMRIASKSFFGFHRVAPSIAVRPADESLPRVLALRPSVAPLCRIVQSD